MANADKSITEFPNGTLTEDSLFGAADVNVGSGYANGKHSASALGAGLCGDGFSFNALETGSKSIFGAINELNRIGDYATVKGTLTAGQTSITLSDNRITTDSMIEVFTSIVGVDPVTTPTVTDGSITISFEAQAVDVVVGINIKGEHAGGGYSSLESAYQRIDKTGVNSIPQTLFTFTATEDCLLTLVGTCATNTGSNEAYIYCEKNGTLEGNKVYLPTNTEQPFSYDLSLDNGDVVILCVSWDGTHTNCFFNLRLGKVVIT